MAEFSLSKKVAQDYLQSKRSFDGQSVNYAVPPFLNGLVASNGALLASEDVIARAIQRNDPQGYQTVVQNIPQTMDRATINGNTINYTEAPDEGWGEDWFAPVSMLATAGAPILSGQSWMQMANNAMNGANPFSSGMNVSGQIPGANSGGGMDFGDNWWGTEYQGDYGVSDYGGTMMPPAQVPTPQQYAEWGMKEVSPGTWTQGGLPVGEWQTLMNASSSMGPMDGLKKLINAITGGGAAGAAATKSLFGANGELNMDALGSILGRAAPGILGAIASGNQADLQRELATAQRQAEQTRYEDLVRRDAERFQTLMGREDAAIGRQTEAREFGRAVGQPSRDRYEASYKPGFTMESDAGYMDALNQSAKATLHGLSVNGNPAGSPNAWAQSLRDNYEKTAYPALQNFRTMNSTAGGYGSYAGAGASVPGIGSSLPGSTSIGSTTGSQAGSGSDASAIGSSGNIWNSLGAAAGNVFSPPKSTLEQLQEFKTLSSVLR